MLYRMAENCFSIFIILWLHHSLDILVLRHTYLLTYPKTQKEKHPTSESFLHFPKEEYLLATGSNKITYNIANIISYFSICSLQ